MKKVILGLFIAIVATTSAMYVSANNKAGLKKYWGSTSTNIYFRIWNNNNYDPGYCMATTDEPCVYRLLRNGPEYVPDYLVGWQINEWVDKGYLEPIGQGLYVWQ